MSIINKELQLQLLCYSGILRVKGDFYHIITTTDSRLLVKVDKNSHTGLSIPSTNNSTAYREISNILWDVAYRATSTNYNVICNITSNATNYLLINLINLMRNPSKHIDNISKLISTTFKEIIKCDQSIRRDIRIKVLSRVKIDHKYPKTEKELIDSLLNIDVSRLDTLVQIYHYYNIYDMIWTVTQLSDRYELMLKYDDLRKHLVLPLEYKNLLFPPSLTIIEEYLLKSLIQIIENYHGLLDRDMVINQLCQFR